jgi:hypothetical protein
MMEWWKWVLLILSLSTAIILWTFWAVSVARNLDTKSVDKGEII